MKVYCVCVCIIVQCRRALQSLQVDVFEKNPAGVWDQ